jgi:MFS superfamily sulfate permease-like transporter
MNFDQAIGFLFVGMALAILFLWSKVTKQRDRIKQLEAEKDHRDNLIQMHVDDKRASVRRVRAKR